MKKYFTEEKEKSVDEISLKMRFLVKFSQFSDILFLFLFQSDSKKKKTVRQFSKDEKKNLEKNQTSFDIKFE